MIKMLKLSTYSFPEVVSSTHLSKDLNEAYIQSDIVVENYVPTPCRGVSKETRKKYKRIKYEERANGYIIIHRFSMFPESKNPVLRAIRYVLINLKQYRLGSKAEKVDLIYSTSTPPTQGVLCGMVKKKLSKRYGSPVPYLYCLQDVFPDSLVNARMTKKGSLIWKIGRKIEDYTYRSADKIIVISNDIKANIMQKGVSQDKISVIPNWIDTTMVTPVPREENTLFDELHLDRNGFYVTYAGNIGKAQSVDTILDAADILKDREDIRFIIFGGGADRKSVENRIVNMHNVSLYPLFPQERVSEVYSLGNLSIIACRKGVGFGAIPSKTFSIMATATPILLSFDKGSELWNLVEQSNCGFLSDAENPSELARRIQEAKSDPAIVKMKGQNAFSLVKRDYSREKGVKAYISVIHDLTKASVAESE